MCELWPTTGSVSAVPRPEVYVVSRLTLRSEVPSSSAAEVPSRRITPHTSALSEHGACIIVGDVGMHQVLHHVRHCVRHCVMHATCTLRARYIHVYMCTYPTFMCMHMHMHMYMYPTRCMCT